MSDDEKLANLEKQHEKRKSKRAEPKSKSWTIDDMEFPSCVVCIGKSKRGKSYLTRYLIQYFTLHTPIFKQGLVFCGTRGLNNDWDMFPDKCIINGYDENILMAWLENIKKVYASGKKLPPSFIIFDDLLGKLGKTKFFDNFLSTYRHYNITIFLNNQFLRQSASSTLLREQANYLFAFRTVAESTIAGLFEWFGGLFKNQEEFKKHFLSITEPKFQAMLFLEAEEDITKNYYGFRAPPPDKFPQAKLNF